MHWQFSVSTMESLKQKWREKLMNSTNIALVNLSKPLTARIPRTTIRFQLFEVYQKIFIVPTRIIQPESPVVIIFWISSQMHHII